MIASLLYICSLQPKQMSTTLTFSDGKFVISRAGKTETVAIDGTSEKGPKFVAYRRNDTWAVWDKRGLTVRIGKTVRSTKLPELAVHPKLQSRPAIRTTLELVKEGKRQKEVSGLSGSRRIGNDVYFLARWDDDNGPWLEALVKVSLDAAKPAYQLVGKFPGLSQSHDAIGDSMGVEGSSLTVIERKEDEWGLSFYTPAVKAFGFKKLGDGLASMAAGVGGQVIFVEKTSYGAKVGGTVDLSGGSRVENFEGRGDVSPVDGLSPVIYRISSEGSSVLHNAQSGAEVSIPFGAHVVRTANGILVWAGKPDSATLYESSRWRPLAKWPTASK